MMRVTEKFSAHEPVMLKEALDGLLLKSGDAAIDCTFGGGGFTRALLDAVAPDGRVLALDRDPEAIERALRWKREEMAERLTSVHASFGGLAAIVAHLKFSAPQGIVADLGLSSLQLAASDRGFSIQTDGPLDMRFDPTSDLLTAAALLERCSIDELERILRRYGEEPQARRIAAAVVAARTRSPIATTGELAAIVTAAVGRRGRLHPATRTFQAIRIAVNDELGELERGLAQMFSLARPGGRIVIISFHSLEDRIVKRAFQAAVRQGAGRIITRRPLRPSAIEVARNPRSRSAKLRILERL